MKKAIVIILVLSAYLQGNSQTGTIRGNVLDAQTGEALIGASVYIDGTTVGGSADLDGGYTIAAGPGTYNLICTYISYENDTIKGITLKSNEVIIQDFAMQGSAVALEMVEIEAKQERNTINYMLMKQRKALSVMDGISSQQIARNGDSDAAGAASRITGISVEGGKYVYVRGLSDRYSRTLLNGAEIPGLDPNRNAVQMDNFASNLIENITVIKAFTPDLPGSFTGGLINIETKDFPEKYTLQYSTSLGYNDQANFNRNYLSAPGGNLDWMGFDDGTRQIPASGTNYIPSLFEDNERLSSATQAFNTNFSPVRTPKGFNQSHSFSVGNQLDLGGKPLGFIAGISYSNEYSYYDNGITGRYNLTGNMEEVDQLNTDLLLNDTRGDHNVLWGALINVSYKASRNHKIGLNVIRNQNGTSTARHQEGIIPVDQVGLHFQTRTMQYLERSLTGSQLRGEHYFEKFKKLKVDWLGSYTYSSQEEPDLRFFANDYTINGEFGQDTVYNLQPALYTVPTRYFRSLSENNLDAKLNFELPLGKSGEKTSKLKWGFSNTMKSRNFEELRFDYRSQSLSYNGSVEDYLSAGNMTAGSPDGFVYVQKVNEDRNSYTGNENIAAAFLMADYYLIKKLRLVGGVRAEKTNIQVMSKNKNLSPGVLNNLDFLPAINLTYALTKKSNFRMAYGRTLARPTFRELAPFGSFDFIGDFMVVGNDTLQRTLIDNYDVRWEIFPRIKEAISFGLFYKKFKLPIERAFNPIAANPELNYRNTESALLYGAEFEVKKSLDIISPILKNFAIGTNVTYIYSEVKIAEDELQAIRATNAEHPDHREMFGQSPYVINGFLTYNNDSIGVSANIGYNVSGPKLAVVVMGGTPNVYEQSAGQLDFSISKTIGNRLSAKISARNLLNPVYRLSQSYKGTEYDFQTYTRGRSFSVGIRYLIN